MPTARLRIAAAVAASREWLLLAMVVSNTNGIAVMGDPEEHKTKADRKRGNPSKQQRPDEAVTCYLAELKSR